MSIRYWAGPEPLPQLSARLSAVGAIAVPAEADPELIVWTAHADPAELAMMLRRLQSVRWVQLPSAGVDDFFEAGVFERDDVVYASCRGAYALPVAEHAVALTLCLFRDLKRRSLARTWGQPGGRLLAHSRVLILGAGGVGLRTAELLASLGGRVSLVGRTERAISIGDLAHQVYGLNQLDDALIDQDLLVIACPLTHATRGLIGARELAMLSAGAYLVNVARGPVVRTEALVRALDSGHIAGAALDVTDPEPLPDEHPLWERPNVVITPHTADTAEMIRPLFIDRTVHNFQMMLAGAPLAGQVIRERGY